MNRYGIILIMGIAILAAPVVCAQKQDAPDAHAAAVITMRGRYVASVDFSLPAGTTREAAKKAWERVKSATGWQFGEARATEDDGVSIRADVLGVQEIELGGMSPAWPFISALSDYSTVALIFLTGQSAPVSASGDFANRYVTAEYSQSQGVRYYNISIKDSSFDSIEQLRSRSVDKPVEDASANRSVRSWLLVAILAVVAGLGAYALARAVIMHKRRR